MDEKIMVADGQKAITKREAEALLWIAKGKTSWEAGKIMGITEATANEHIASAARKLGAVNRANLIARAFVFGVLKPCCFAALISVIAMAANDDGMARRIGRTRPRRDEIISVAMLAQICATD